MKLVKKKYLKSNCVASNFQLVLLVIMNNYSASRIRCYPFFDGSHHYVTATLHTQNLPNQQREIILRHPYSALPLLIAKSYARRCCVPIRHALTSTNKTGLNFPWSH